MTVDVDQTGVILIGDADILLTGQNNIITFSVSFGSIEDAERYFNAMKASLKVGCIHIHGETTTQAFN